MCLGKLNATTALLGSQQLIAVKVMRFFLRLSCWQPLRAVLQLPWPNSCVSD